MGNGGNPAFVGTPRSFSSIRDDRLRPFADLRRSFYRPPMQTIGSYSLFAMSLASALLVSCSGPVTRKVEGHTFKVPDANNVKDSDRPFFLPSPSGSDGFSFTLNPQAALPDRILIHVASKKEVCRRAEGTQADVNSGLCSSKPFLWRDARFAKTGDAVFWQYRLSGGEISGATVVVRCTQSSSAVRKGLCASVLPYHDLALTVHMTDNRVEHLAALYDEAVTHLRTWER